MKFPATTISPFAENAKAHLLWEEAEMTFRNERFIINQPYYECEKTFEQFTTAKMDGYALNEVFRQYREKYNITETLENGYPAFPGNTLEPNKE